MLDIIGYEGKYSIDDSQSPYQIWSHRRPGCMGKYLDIILINGKRSVSLVASNRRPGYHKISDLVWKAHHPNDDLTKKIMTFRDGDSQNDDIDNLVVKDRFKRDEDGNIILSFQ
jgi:hypothetical protein